LSNISPGCVGGRCFGNIIGLSVIILAPDVVRVFAFEPQRDSVLVVHPDTERAGALALERLQPVAGRPRFVSSVLPRLLRTTMPLESCGCLLGQLEQMCGSKTAEVIP